jgi:tRNA dimethylallyltransferase
MLSNIQSSIDQFLEKKSDLPKIILIYGPTACGKTGLSIEIAKYIQSEIISVDSRQIYRWLDIGTGKVTTTEMQWITHHMLDIVDPTEVFSVVNYREMTTPILEKLYEEKKIPILCGGTGLYIDSIIYERSYPTAEIDWDFRNELEAYRINHGNQALWEKLHAIDPAYADTLHPNNYRYVIRGIEVYTKSGQSKWSIIDTPRLKYDTLFVTPYDWDRPGLYSKIDLRVKQMFDNWLVEEVEYIMDNLSDQLLQNCNNWSCPWLASIWYTEVVDYLQWKITLEDCISLVQQHNRNYAKRQITWNKKYEK